MVTKMTNRKPAALKTTTEPALLKLFTDEIRDIYWAEKHLTKAFPKMQKAATTEELANVIGEHYEIATYGSLAQLAKTLELEDVANLFQQTLDEGKGEDQTLTSIAENHINYQAIDEEEE